jgi:hypothetical protein
MQFELELGKILSLVLVDGERRQDSRGCLGVANPGGAPSAH